MLVTGCQRDRIVSIFVQSPEVDQARIRPDSHLHWLWSVFWVAVSAGWVRPVKYLCTNCHQRFFSRTDEGREPMGQPAVTSSPGKWSLKQSWRWLITRQTNILVPVMTLTSDSTFKKYNIQPNIFVFSYYTITTHKKSSHVCHLWNAVSFPGRLHCRLAAKWLLMQCRPKFG